jgi:hypothetical protein
MLRKLYAYILSYLVGMSMEFIYFEADQRKTQKGEFTYTKCCVIIVV